MRTEIRTVAASGQGVGKAEERDMKEFSRVFTMLCILYYLHRCIHGKIIKLYI